MRFTTQTPPPPVVVNAVAFSKARLEAGALSCTLNLKNNNAGDVQNLTALALLYNGERLEAVSYRTAAVALAQSQDFSVTLAVPDAPDLADYFVKVYVMDTMRALNAFAPEYTLTVAGLTVDNE
jgi:hypothetical protein